MPSLQSTYRKAGATSILDSLRESGVSKLRPAGRPQHTAGVVTTSPLGTQPRSLVYILSTAALTPVHGPSCGWPAAGRPQTINHRRSGFYRKSLPVPDRRSGAVSSLRVCKICPQCFNVPRLFTVSTTVFFLSSILTWISPSIIFSPFAIFSVLYFGSFYYLNHPLSLLSFF